MDVDLIFKIAAIGILVSVFKSGVGPLRGGRTGDNGNIGRTGSGLDDDCSADQRFV